MHISFSGQSLAAQRFQQFASINQVPANFSSNYHNHVHKKDDEEEEEPPLPRPITIPIKGIWYA